MQWSGKPEPCKSDQCGPIFCKSPIAGFLQDYENQTTIQMNARKTTNDFCYQDYFKIPFCWNWLELLLRHLLEFVWKYPGICDGFVLFVGVRTSW